MPRGRVKEMSNECRFWQYVDTSAGELSCWKWLSATSSNGYGAFWLNKKMSSYKAHRFMWEITNGPIPKGMFICHHCDNPGCVNPSHLFMGTPYDNNRDMISKGRRIYGSNKITAEQAREIRGSHGIARIVAAKYGINHCTVSKIRARTIWKDA